MHKPDSLTIDRCKSFVKNYKPNQPTKTEARYIIHLSKTMTLRTLAKTLAGEDPGIQHTGIQLVEAAEKVLQ